MLEHYDIEQLVHNPEPKPKLRTFINLDGNKLGISINWELGGIRFFIYDGKKRKNQIMHSRFFNYNTSLDKIIYILFSLVRRYYKQAGRLVPNDDGILDLPIYCNIELQKYASHLYYAIDMNKLKKVLSKEVIWY